MTAQEEGEYFAIIHVSSGFCWLLWASNCVLVSQECVASRRKALVISVMGRLRKMWVCLRLGYGISALPTARKIVVISSRVFMISFIAVAFIISTASPSLLLPHSSSYRQQHRIHHRFHHHYLSPPSLPLSNPNHQHFFFIP